MKGIIRLAVLALAVGMAAGWFGANAWGRKVNCSACQAGQAESPAAQGVSPLRTAARSDGGELDSLRRRAEDLRRQMDALKKPETGDSAAGEKTLDMTTLGEWRKTHPKGLETESIEYVCEGFEKYEAFLDGFDLSRLSAEDRALVERHFGLVKKRCDMVRSVNFEDDSQTMGVIGALFLKSGEFYHNANTISKPVTAALVGAAVERRARERGYPDEDAAVIADAFRALWEVGNLEF